MVTSTATDTTGDGKPNLVITCDVASDGTSELKKNIRAVAEAVKFCSYCGNRLPASAAFCDRCGTECEAEAGPPVVSSTMEEKQEDLSYAATALTLKHIVDAIEEWGKSSLSFSHQRSADDCDMSVEEITIGAHVWKCGVYGQQAPTPPAALELLDEAAPPPYSIAVPEMGNWTIPIGLNMPLSAVLQGNRMQLTFKADTTVETAVMGAPEVCCTIL